MVWLDFVTCIVQLKEQKAQKCISFSLLYAITVVLYLITIVFFDCLWMVLQYKKYNKPFVPHYRINNWTLSTLKSSRRWISKKRIATLHKMHAGYKQVNTTMKHSPFFLPLSCFLFISSINTFTIDVLH